jgi:hypothetical protein
MTFQRQFSLAALTILLSVLAVAQSPQAVSLPVGSATVAEFKGDVSLLSPKGEALPLQRGLVLAPESVIETAKGTILLSLQDGSQVLVRSHSHVVLQNPEQAKGNWLELTLGKILAKIRKRTGETPSFRMGTPTAVITVRGTQFEVEVDKRQRTRVEVYEGIVEVMGFAPGTHAVLVRPGFFTNIRNGRDPDAPRQALEANGQNDAGRSGEDNPYGSQGRSTGEDQQQPGNPPNPSDHEPPDLP